MDKNKITEGQWVRITHADGKIEEGTVLAISDTGMQFTERRTIYPNGNVTHWNGHSYRILNDLEIARSVSPVPQHILDARAAGEELGREITESDLGTTLREARRNTREYRAASQIAFFMAGVRAERGGFIEDEEERDAFLDGFTETSGIDRN